MVIGKLLQGKIKQFIGVTSIIVCQISLPAMASNADEEKLWQQKSQLVINHLADN